MENKPKVKKHIDQYVVFEDKLGAGQFSTVYKAMDRKNQNQNYYYAIKQIALNKLNLTEQPQQKELLQKEIDILLKARHPNLMQLHDMKQSPNNLYLVLDFCNGGDLKSYMQKKGGRLGEARAVQFFKELAHGYNTLHEQNIIHRDLKPENILLHNDHVKIGDFGFARFVTGDMNTALRMTIKCSPLYAPPQLLQNLNYSSKCDVFSMGVVFYEMLYGETPFMAQTVQGLVEDMKAKLINGKLQFPENISVADVIKDLISKMLQYDECNRISWQEVYSHSLFSYTPICGLIDFELEDGTNPLTKSIEQARNSLKEYNYKQIIQEEKMQMEMDDQVSQYTDVQSFNNDDDFVSQMQKITQNEQKNKVFKVIDQYIQFCKNKALFTNKTLINFWNSFQKNQSIKPFVKCQILVCLSGYHYYFLVTWQKILNSEVPQTIFKQETFNGYLKSQYYQLTMDQIIENVKNAEILYKELEPLCMKEFLNTVQNQNIPDQDKNDVKSFVQMIEQPTVTFDIYFQYFPKIIPKVFQNLNLDNQDIDLQTLQSLYLILIFSQMDYFFPPQNYQDIDFQLFEENNLINLDFNQLKQEIKNILMKL